MSFRRKHNHDVELQWRRWLHEHSNELAQLGIPRAFYSSRLAWSDFVQTGSGVYTDAGIGRELHFADLSIDEQKRLLEFLERAVPESTSQGLVRMLRVRASHGWIPPFGY